MNLERVRPVVDAVLYEGYILYPYRAATAKNRQRWTFGGVYPKDWFDATHGSDPWTLVTECLLSGADEATVEVRLRFLQPLARDVGETVERADSRSGETVPPHRPVAELTIDGERHCAWQEAVEREVVVARDTIAGLRRGVEHHFSFAGRDDTEPLRDGNGIIRGVLLRRQPPLTGLARLDLQPVDGEVWRLKVRVENLTVIDPAGISNREQASLYSFASSHVILGVDGGEFISLIDPPAALAETAAACDNDGAWPVLVGEPGRRDTVLCSPIILYDYPEVAAESPGDLFDATEIDEILSLNILAMTDEEKRDMVATDPRARALLERTEGLTADDFMRLHGTLREPRPADDRHRRAPPPVPKLVSCRGRNMELAVGDRVRLKPKAGGDVWDITLAGRTAVVESIERDFDDRVHVAVAIEDDPGRQWGFERMPGHRFFFDADEVERLGPGRAESPR